MDAILEFRNVLKYFPVHAGGAILRRYKMCQAVDDVSFGVARKACFGIVGESGSGKTTIAKLILQLESLTGGSIFYEGEDVRNIMRRRPMWYRSNVQTIFQDAASSLNPRMRIRDIINEPLEVQRGQRLSKEAVQSRTADMITRVGLGMEHLSRYPHELSGGQKQRVAIARSIILEPSLVVLDEPVSALDISIRAQILNLLADIQEKEGLTYIIIAHDLAMLEHVTTHLAVMYLGKIMEMGRTEAVVGNPCHPYTKALFAAIPRPEPGRKKVRSSLSGEIGNPIDPPPGCRFNPRCPISMAECRRETPPLQEISPGHQAACYLANK